jgi:hypothetical protein
MRLFIGKKTPIVTALVPKEPPSPDKSRYCRLGRKLRPVERCHRIYSEILLVVQAPFLRWLHGSEHPKQ